MLTREAMGVTRAVREAIGVCRALRAETKIPFKGTKDLSAVQSITFG